MLKKLIVKNYKSLADLTLELKPLNVFVGPNNAGKSNIFDCLKFLNDFATPETAETAVTIRGGFEQVVFNGSLKDPISIRLEGVVPSEKKTLWSYNITLLGTRGGGCEVGQETFDVTIENKKSKLFQYPIQSKAIIWDLQGKQLFEYTPSWSSKPALFDQFRYLDAEMSPEIAYVVQEIRKWAFYNFLPPLMQDTKIVKRETAIDRFGQNAPVVLHFLQSEYPKNFRKIEETLKEAVPELKELSTGLTKHTQGQTFIRIEEKGISLQIPAWAMSDGTLRFLAHLSVLYNPNPPTLVCFEEPENYIHPHLLELLASLIKITSEKAQIIVNTHSPYLLDWFSYENLAIVEKIDGKTQVKWAEDEWKNNKQGLKEAAKKLGLGGMWHSGSLGGNP